MDKLREEKLSTSCYINNINISLKKRPLHWPVGYKKRLRRAEVCSPLWLGTWKWSGSGAAEPRFYSCNQTEVKLEMTGILISSHLQRKSSLHGKWMKHKAFYDMRISLPQLISQSDPQRSGERSDDFDWNSQFEMFGILLQTLYFNIFFLSRRPFPGTDHGCELVCELRCSAGEAACLCRTNVSCYTGSLAAVSASGWRCRGNMEEGKGGVFWSSRRAFDLPWGEREGESGFNVSYTARPRHAPWFYTKH